MEGHGSRAVRAGDAERRRLLVEWNATEAPFPRDADLASLFEAQAATTTDAVAAVAGETRLTYGELNRRANRIAHHLQRRGVGPEVLVGVCVERSLQTVVTLLGILKAGGAYLPLDPSHPAPQLAFILRDTRVGTVLTQTGLRHHLPPSPAAVVCLDAEADSLARESEENPRRTVTAGNLAFVMYTSGSTGEPKGVAAPHRQLINRFAWMWRTHPYAAADGFCHRSPVNHVISMFELLEPLLAGARTVVPPEEATKDAYLFARELEAHAVTRTIVVPSLMRMLLDTNLDLARHMAALRIVLVTGEALPLELCRRFKARLPGARLINHYGASEVNALAAWEVPADGPADGVAPIGRPLSNTQLYVVDDDLEPVPVGTPGELYVGSVGNTRGYFNRPDLTAERFVPNPFGAEPGARLYRTGDMARHRPDGTIEIVGRRDNQVRIRGMRVELDGIEAVLCRCPDVQQAAVTAREGAAGDRRLVAYVVARPGATPGTGALRRFARAHLPAHMVPAHFVFLDGLPLTPSGKLDRRRLPEPVPGVTAGAYAAPRTPLEERLSRIWASALAVDRVGVDDDFFNLGGNSLLATQVVSGIREACHVEVPVRALFEHPSVAGLAQAIVTELLLPGDDEALRLLEAVELLSPEAAAVELQGRAPAAARPGP